MAKKPFDAAEILVSLNTEVTEDVQKTALAVLANVVRGTPVGDPKIWQTPSKPQGYAGGHARRNWNVSIGVPADVVRGTAGSGPGAGGATSEAISDGERIIDRFDVNKRRIIIQNNVPYIVPLNMGHSTQAPVNFVEKAVQAGRTKDINERKDLP